jgi:hypothetical protein
MSPTAEATKDLAKAEARVASMMGPMSGSDTLIMGGAALFLIIGELIFGELLNGGFISFAGVLAGEVIFFNWLTKPATGRVAAFATATASAIVAALVIAIVLLTLSEFIGALKSLPDSITGGGIAVVLYRLSRWVGAVMMALGVLAVWGPAQKK